MSVTSALADPLDQESPMTRARLALTLWLTAGAWLLFVPAAHAYLDPGSTSVIFGALVAGAMGAGMVLKTFWRRFTGFFRRDGGDSAREDGAEQVDARGAGAEQVDADRP